MDDPRLLPDVPCPVCAAAPGERCLRGFGPVTLVSGPAVFIHATRAWRPPAEAVQSMRQRTSAAAQERARIAREQREAKRIELARLEAERRERWEASRVARQEQEQRAAEAERASSERRRRLDSWTEDDPIGKKRQRLVRWLMRKGKPLDEARLIAWRKYQ